MRSVKAVRRAPSLREIQRFARNVEHSEDGHWRFMLHRNTFRFGAHEISPRRMAWRIYKGAIPAQSYVIVVCGVKECINPEHAQLVPSDNELHIKRVHGWLAPDVCPQGHRVEGTNVLRQRFKTKKGRIAVRVRCRTCFQKRQRDGIRAKKRASA